MRMNNWCRFALAAGIIAAPSNRLLAGEKYVYDGSGNLLEKRVGDDVTRMRYSPSNRIEGIENPSGDSINVRYDSAGRPVAYANGRGEVQKELEYGYSDKIVSVVQPAEGKRCDLYYNAEGFLVGKKSDEGEMTVYSWDGLALSSTNDEALVTEEGIEGGTPILFDNSEQVVVSDYLGNTLCRGDQSLQGSAFGEGLEAAWFTGKPYVPELGGFVFQNRVYSSSTGRWLTHDPIGYPDGFNSFAYLGDPTSGVDPVGTKVVEISNTVRTPTPGSGTLSPPSGTVTWTAFGAGDNGTGGAAGSQSMMGFRASLSHNMTGSGAPLPNKVEVAVSITANESLKKVFWTPLANVYQSNGTAGQMGMTAKMSANGAPSISANVTAGAAFSTATLSGVNGVTDTQNAANVSVAGSASLGVAMGLGGGNWAWAEN